MSKYRINKIGISNFKIFDKYFEQLFDGDDLIVFDGPNGFGKTSIFDAIELGLTGVIKRLDLYDDSVKNKLKSHKIPFINNDKAPFFLKIELVSPKGKLIICRFLEKENVGKKEKGKIKWENIKLGTLNSWEDGIENTKIISQSKLEGLLSVPDLKRIFNIFFYVQQEENTFFLKRSENDRKEYLNILFDVGEEVEIQKKLDRLVKLNKEYVEEKNVDIKALEKSMVQVEDSENISNIMYTKLFKDSEHEWDKEDLDFKKFSMNNVVQGLDVIKGLLKDRKIFSEQYKASRIKSFFSSPELIKSFSLYLNYSTKYKDIEGLIRKKTSYLKCVSRIENDKFLLKEFWKELGREVAKDVGFDAIELETKIERYNDLKKNHDKLQSSRLEVSKVRDTLKGRFKEFIVASDDKDQGDCPFCGHDWENLETLFKAIAKEEEKFGAIEQSNVKQSYDEVLNSSKVFKQLILDNFKNNYYPPEELLSLMRTSARGVDIFNELLVYFKRADFELGFGDRFLDINGLDDLGKFSEELEGQILDFLDDKKTIDDETFLSYEKMFSNYFEKDFSKIQIDISGVEDKKLFLKSKHHEFLKGSNAGVQKQIEHINAHLTEVKLKVDNVKKLSAIYQSRITAHISRIINDISIPFYINSGRILQDFYGGSGVFVKMGSLKTDGVKFFSKLDSEIDPLYNLSSGQLSSLVLSFSLTLNDVYQDHFLGMILIDDPIQTMDEINTITFIDLIRNSFKDRQFLISTHEDSFSSLIRYKFKQNNSKVSVVRMKEAI